ncbi:glycosyl hydrolase-related protein [Treponema primitia]|uniref:glycoside hydrolase family 38 N-terminal domain-containing protein n=1 Tax=Treponema primitia TaxID=88058 RepID=UPI00025550ED|nr:glycoside hydrolase family 38 C-terminal domain-containing protein [Treponema primitia]
MMQPKKILYLASTHWDREWYLSFQSFRFHLIPTLDKVITILEQEPDFSVFVLDGQTILLEDYLEIKPENRRRLEKLIADGRLKVGPWYTMPDEILCSGESLVNNLQFGFSLAREFGAEPMKYGYVCDIFGHIAQLPQILNSFGIEGALLGRGTNNYNCGAHFIWQSPDGSRCITFKVPEEYGYGTFHYDVIAPYQSGKNTNTEDMVSRAIEYVEKELARSPVPYVILMDGMDHETIHEESLLLARELAEKFDCPVEFGSPDQLLPELMQYAKEMSVHAGELQETARELAEHNKLIPNTLSSRYDIKLWNDQCQTLMERSAAPMAVLAGLAGKTVLANFFSVAGKLIAESQAHDSICGCSIDAVAYDVLNRYRQAETICREIIDFTTAAVTDLVDTGGESDYLKLTLFNTEPEDFSGVIRACIDFPIEYSARNSFLDYEPYNMFTIQDASGTGIPYQLLDVEFGRFVTRPQQFYRKKRDRYYVALPVNIPAMACTELKICPNKTPVRNAGTLLSSPRSAENDHMLLTINEQGTLTLKDKHTGRVYTNLLSFRNYGETGDGWFHRPPVGNPVTLDQGCAVTVELTLDGSELCVFTITKYIRLPSNLEKSELKTKRSGETKEVSIRSKIYFTRTSRWIEVETTIDNTILDHKMTVAFATGLNTPEYETDQAFAIVSRRAGVHRETNTWKEYDRGEHGFSNLVMRRDAKTGGGLAFISKGGMHECAAHTDEEGALEITLFRSFGNTVFTNGESDGQLSGILHFNFALLPLNSGDSNGTIIKLRNSYINTPWCYSTRIPADRGLKSSTPAFKLESNNITLSILRPAKQEGFICVRLINYGDTRETARLLFGASIEEAYASNLLEEKQGTAVFKNRELSCSLDPYKIGTFIVKLKG